MKYEAGLRKQKLNCLSKAESKIEEKRTLKYYPDPVWLIPLV